MISFVVPAFNERDYLARTIGAIHDAARAVGRPYEIVVADDASTDGTGPLAESLGARVVRCENRQIAATRNAGARAASGEVLIFVDADTIVNPDVVAEAVRAIDEGAIGGGAAVEWDGPVALHWRLFVRSLIRFFRLVKFAAGSFVFCTRGAFEATGGFDESVYATEEIWFSQALKKQGRFVILEGSVLTSARKLTEHSTWHVAKTLFLIVLKGRRAIRKREGLELWYDQRT